jgi:hypothetical protein
LKHEYSKFMDEYLVLARLWPRATRRRMYLHNCL